ncbi:tripartite tricarboxylate transporter TctB family protein [Tropicibacter naphthalenivorans]|uniref:Tripartite tricarboxylate transporter TctB family protein n=1 Tax=Tropicibacter naphthalenivorans TaxID=441103 RepID=A0A0P1H397_9RHOB|nr:tripartite tricarboxylate transporter TctB family protein [Tropicibacter naphthalenivorans]CUH82236.1 Tripartite tricarboxylate transporter TctB family protein [Tropicibacter naphthalenivorans]SMD04836.1 Tripartite tricarboxylate transporter TctB family protein [Tropicibacter naphthalenivorans]
MTDRPKNRLLRPETLTALGIVAVAAGFLIPTSELPPISALLPAAMLIGLIALSVALLVMDQRKAAKGDAAAPMTQSPKRVLGAFGLILGYALATDFIGFYVSTAVTIPLVAFAFGYRNPLGLLIATVIVVGTIWAIFDFGMSQDFPTGRLWKD